MCSYDAYGNFAQYYDELTEDIPYEKWADYFCAVFEKYQVSPQIVLDLACGTGNMTMALSRRGFDMIGIDASVDMLSIAREKDVCEQTLYLAQQMTDFELYGTVGAVVCCLDSLNYLDREEALLRCFQLVELYLDPGGIFIFDLNTAYKLAQVLGNQTFVMENERLYLVWQNEYDQAAGACTMDLDFFEYAGTKVPTKPASIGVKGSAASDEDGYEAEQNNPYEEEIVDTGMEIYTRFHETHTEYAYEIKTVENLLAQAGFIQIDVYDELSFAAPRPDSQRVFFVARAGKEKKLPDARL